MKIKFLSDIAEQSFRTSPSGERLFFHGSGFWCKSYIIPNEETKKRLFKKQLWMVRIFLGVLILGQSLLLIVAPNIINVPLLFVLNLLAVVLLYWLVNWLVFRNELQSLARTDISVSPAEFCRDIAKRYSVFGLSLGFLGSIGLVLVESWTLKNHAFTSWFGIIFFGLCAIVWSYILYLKLTMPKNIKAGGKKKEA